MKKTAILFTLFCALSFISFSQRVINEKIDISGQEVKMEFKFADDITLEAWNKDYIELQVKVDINNNKYNEYYSLEIDQSGAQVKLIEEVDFDRIKKLEKPNKTYNFDTNLNYALKVPKHLKIDLETISGEVELLGCQGQLKINSISGFIDYSIPEDHKASINLSTVTGDVYSNVKFDEKEAREITWVGTKEQLSLNGGNTAVKLKTVSGDIFLRKY
jgi:hypothetical protein